MLISKIMQVLLLLSFFLLILGILLRKSGLNLVGILCFMVYICLYIYIFRDLDLP